MRRGSLNKISIILIVVAGIFSLASFVLDQLVVQTEDKIRQKELEYKKTLFNLNNFSSINSNFQYLSQITESKFRSLERRNETIKVMLTNLLDEEYTKSIYSDYTEFATQEQINDFTNSVKNSYKREYILLYSDHTNEIISIKKILKYIKFNNDNLQNIFNEIDKITEINIDDNLIKNLSKKNYNSLFNSYDEINEIYFKMISLGENLRNVYKTISILESETANKWYDYGVQIETIEKKLSKLEVLENNFILFSILCQILGLVSLLVLFRILLIN